MAVVERYIRGCLTVMRAAHRTRRSAQLGSPLASAFLLIWYPQEWWDWTSNPTTDLFSWAAATIALAIGAAATTATPWRTKNLVPKMSGR